MRSCLVSTLLVVVSWGSLAQLVPNSTNPQEWPSGDIIERDVAIIGGGSAGTYTAVRLRDMEKSVVVIEKDIVLGGHTDTYSKFLSII